MQPLSAVQDVKPSNCLVTAAGSLKLADFGSACRMQTPLGPAHTTRRAQYRV